MPRQPNEGGAVDLTVTIRPDQKQALNEFAEEDTKLVGRRVALSELARMAFDMYLNARRSFFGKQPTYSQGGKLQKRNARHNASQTH